MNKKSRKGTGELSVSILGQLYACRGERRVSGLCDCCSTYSRLLWCLINKNDRDEQVGKLEFHVVCKNVLLANLPKRMGLFQVFRIV